MSFVRAKELFLAALDLPEAQRAAFLVQACGDDVSLREEVESLLAFHDPEPSQPASDAARPIVFAAGDLFAGRYRMIRRLGRGGMGDVWSADDLFLHTQVAIKLIHGGSEQSRAVMLNEVRLARQITHPAICRVFDVSESDGQVFYTMELVDGEDLAAVLRRVERLSSEKVVDIARQLCAGIAAAHAEGVLHRDLKPANVLIDGRGQVRITDFGVAISRRTADRTLPMGTPAYMAPEQLVPGERLSEQTDLYALGLVLYELAHGTRLFDGAEPRVDPSTISTRHDDVDPVLNGVIHWALALSPADRPPSAAAMAARLEAGGGSTPGWIARWAAFASSRTALAAALGVAVVALALIWGRTWAPSALALNDRDALILADFDNTTGEPVFDRTLKVALAVALEQSPFLKVFPDERIAETLRLMERPPDTRLSRTVAREVARREQLKAFVAGSIASLGSHYVLALEAINAQSGDAMARTQAEASSREEVLTRLGEAAAQLRQRLGESLASIERFDVPLPSATTPSLEALHAYALALDDGRVNVRLSAIPHLKRAIELDPDFALAHAMLSGVYANTDQPGMAPAFARRAFDLRARVSERERFFISWRYYRDGAFAEDKALELTRSWVATYPRESVAFNSYAITLKEFGRYDEAIDAYRESMRLDPRFFAPYGNSSEALLALNRLDEAAEQLALAEERRLAGAAVRRVSYLLAFMRNDREAMAQAIERGGTLAETNPLSWDARTALFNGDVRRGHEQFVRAVDLAVSRGLDESGAQMISEDAEGHAIAGACGETRREMARALSISRDYFTLRRGARSFAFCGDVREMRALNAELLDRFPDAFLVHRVLTPIDEAIVALRRGQPEEARRLLAPVAPYENTPIAELWPWYLNGVAWLQLNDGSAAVTEFRKVLANQGVRPTSLAYPLARLGLARGLSLSGDRAGARSAYDDFLSAWTDDSVPFVREARAERAALR